MAISSTSARMVGLIPACRLRESTAKLISADQIEIARLRAELAKARMERDILKKVIAYFARESR